MAIKNISISTGVSEALKRAVYRAMANKWELVSLEMFLSEMLDDKSTRELIEKAGGNVELVREELEDYINETAIKHADNEKEPSFSPQPVIAIGRMLERAQAHVISCQRADHSIHSLDLLIAMLADDPEDSMAASFLLATGVSRLALFEVDRELRDKDPRPREHPVSEEDEESGFCAQSSALKDPLLIYARDLNELAKSGRIDPLIGRDAELERLVQILCRRRKNNPLIVGEAGVGKTAIVEGLARRIVENKVPAVLANKRLYALDMGALIADAKFRGEFEGRLKGVLASLAKRSDAILFIDEIHTVISTGDNAGSGMAAGNLLKPALANGELVCIGATTYTEFRRIFEKDHALTRRFQKLEISEPTQGDTLAILKGLASHFESHHKVRYTPEALEAAVALSSRYITDRRLPDKAIDVIDEAGAAARVKRAAGSSRFSKIDVSQVEAVVSRMARVPVQNVTQQETSRLKHLESSLKNAIFGQDKAIESVCAAIKMTRSGLGKSDSPIGSFLFAGPTGVGKTELARQLAQKLGVSLIRFDMSEYMEAHSVSRLIGAPPGYVGFDKGGLLTEAVNREPYAVVLLDEIEKAHPDINNILLQVMDHGTLTDNNGRKTDFRNTILIMTTNAGAQALGRRVIGFGNVGSEGDDSAEIRRRFTPEFRNRLDAIVHFESLSELVILKVVDKFLKELSAQLAQKNVKAVFTSRFKRYLAEKGFDPKMGARPMQRLIAQTVRQQLADELLYGALVRGGAVTVDVDRSQHVKIAFKAQ